MISAPRMRPPATATTAPRPDTNPERTPVVIMGAASSTAARAVSSASWSMPRASVCFAASCSAAVVESPIWSAWSITPRVVATTTPTISSSRPSTTRPAPRLGLIPRRCSVPRRGRNTTASTAANVIGSTISLTAARAPNTMTPAITTPTKLHAQTPSFGTRPSSPGAPRTPGPGSPAVAAAWVASAGSAARASPPEPGVGSVDVDMPMPPREARVAVAAPQKAIIRPPQRACPHPDRMMGSRDDRPVSRCAW